MALKIDVQRLQQFFQLAMNQSKFDKAGLVRLRSLLLVGESGIGLHRDSYGNVQKYKNGLAKSYFKGKSTAIAIAAKHFNFNVRAVYKICGNGNSY